MTDENDLIRRGDVTAIPLLGMTVTQIDRAIRAIPAAAPVVTVKPLVWESVGNPNGRYRLHSTIAWARNTCPYGPYFIGLSSSCKDGEYSWDGPMNTGCRGFSDPEIAKAAAQADYEARILSALTIQPAYPRSELAVWYGKMPESNGRENWTASIHRKGGDIHMDGFCFARSEYPDRVRYEADRMRWIIGDLSEKPHILDYDAELHSGYITKPADPLSDPRVMALVRAATKIASLQKNTLTDIGSAHSNRGAGASGWMREDDRDFMRDLHNAFTSVTAALRSIGGEA